MAFLVATLLKQPQCFFQMCQRRLPVLLLQQQAANAGVGCGLGRNILRFLNNSKGPAVKLKRPLALTCGGVQSGNAIHDHCLPAMLA